MKRWKPKIGERVYFINIESGLFFIVRYILDESYAYVFSKKSAALGYYKTKREAQAMIRAINKLVWGK